MAIGKTALDALKEFWHARFGGGFILRSTYGDAKLTKAYTLCDILERDLKVPGMRDLGEKLLHGRAGELGYDTDTSIKAIEAASEKGATIQSNRRDE
jgi:hypothetical protein